MVVDRGYRISTLIVLSAKMREVISKKMGYTVKSTICAGAGVECGLDFATTISYASS